MSDDGISDLQAFFYQLVHAIALNPGCVDVMQRKQDRQLVITVFVAEEDLQRFSVEGGRTLRALDTVLTSIARRDNIQASLEVIGRPTATPVN